MDPLPRVWLYSYAACEFFLRFPNLKIGTDFRGPPVLPPCCKACALTPHPFTYAAFGVFTGCRPT
jgi:hypothetical protein